MKPFTAPPFDPGKHKPKTVFYWWSWHPAYPYWSRSCWGGDTEEKAWEKFKDPRASGLRDYHNKLIKEENGTFTEIADVPFDPNKA